MATVECEVCRQTLPPGSGAPEICEHMRERHPYLEIDR